MRLTIEYDDGSAEIIDDVIGVEHYTMECLKEAIKNSMNPKEEITGELLDYMCFLFGTAHSNNPDVLLVNEMRL